MVCLVFGKLLYLLWHFYATRPMVIVVNGQRLNDNLGSLLVTLAMFHI